MGIKAVAFDMEGTLVDVEFAHHEAFRLMAADEGCDFTLEEAIETIPGFIGGGDPAVIAGIIEKMGRSVSEELVEELRKRKMVHYNRILETISVQIRPGASEVINWLNGHGYGVTIGSLTPKNQAEVLFSKTGLDTIFGRERIVLREDVAEVKPEPYVYLETAKRVGVLPEEQLVFEDSGRGIIAARRAGSLVVAMPVYNNPAAIKEVVEAGAIRVFMDWREMNIVALIDNLDSTPS